MNYRDEVIRSAKRIHPEDHLLMAAFGLCVETASVADLFKKFTFHNFKFDRKLILAELGDVLWYFEFACVNLNITITEIPEVQSYNSEDVFLQLALKLARRGSWCADHISDVVLAGKTPDKEEMIKRLSEVLACVNCFAELLNSSIEEIQQDNIIKINKDYPERFK
jgi:NTP pyrophosphatase (non-canonical NTP hydrolase)